MAVQFTVAVRNSRMEALRTALGAGGTLPVRTGARPGVAVADTGTLLCTFTNVVLSVAANGATTMSATADNAAAAAGTPGHGRLLTSAGVAVAEMDAGVGAGELNFSTAVSQGGVVTFNGGPFTDGNA